MKDSDYDSEDSLLIRAKTTKIPENYNQVLASKDKKEWLKLIKYTSVLFVSFQYSIISNIQWIRRVISFCKSITKSDLYSRKTLLIITAIYFN